MKYTTYKINLKDNTMLVRYGQTIKNIESQGYVLKHDESNKEYYIKEKGNIRYIAITEEEK